MSEENSKIKQLIFLKQKESHTRDNMDKTDSMDKKSPQNKLLIIFFQVKCVVHLKAQFGCNGR